MLWKKPSKPNSEENSTEVTETPEEALAQFNATRTALRRKGLTTAAALLLLVCVAVVGTMAWYTRISNVTGMTMDVADFDFNANYSDESFVINVDGYLSESVTSGKAAPGTKGVIPLKISAEDSQVAVTYSIALDFSEMADPFRERLRFYYYTRSGSTYTLHVINPTTSTSAASTITGSIPVGGTKYEYLYWEWIYELDDSSNWFYDNGSWYLRTDYYKTIDVEIPVEEGQEPIYEQQDKTYNYRFTEELYPTTIAENQTKSAYEIAVDAFDDFDTSLGLGEYDATMTTTVNGVNKTFTADGENSTANPKLTAYQKAMKLKLHVTGAQAVPIQDGGTAPSSDTEGTAVYKANG